MSIKNIAIFIAGSLIVISGFSLFFSSHDVKRKSDPSRLDNSARTKMPLSKAPTLSNVKKTVSQRNSWSGIVLAKDKVAVYPPESGRLLDLSVKGGDRVEHGDILAKIQNKKSLARFIYKKDLFDNEISMKKMDIKIAQEDITRIEEEIDDIEAKIQETEYSDNEQGETQEQLKMHYETSQDMLKTKFKAIKEYEDRIEELKGLISRLTDSLVVKAPCDGMIGRVFFEPDQVVDQKTPLLEIMPVNQLSLRIQGMLPFSLDGKEVKIAFKDKQEYTGILRIKSFSTSKEGGKTTVKVILNQGDALYTPGKKVALLFR